MHHDPVSRVQEHDADGEKRRRAAEAARSEEPRGHRGRIEQRHEGLGERSVEEVEQHADDERRERRPSQHVSEVDRVGVEELAVRTEVRREVASAGERDGHCLKPPHADGRDGDNERGPTGLRSGGQPADQSRCIVAPAHQPDRLASLRPRSWPRGRKPYSGGSSCGSSASPRGGSARSSSSAIGLAVYAVRAIAWPLKPGRDLDEYLLRVRPALRPRTSFCRGRCSSARRSRRSSRAARSTSSTGGSRSR